MQIKIIVKHYFHIPAPQETGIYIYIYLFFSRSVLGFTGRKSRQGFSGSQFGNKNQKTKNCMHLATKCFHI